MSELKINSEALRHLQANERFSHIYLNDKGGWLFVPHPDYRNVVSREEALKGFSGEVESPLKAAMKAAAEEHIAEQNSKKSNKK